MTAVEVAVAALLGGLWLVTAAAQLPRRVSGSIRRRDVFILIPDWRFFAPRPGTMDYVLVYRDQLVDGNLTGWHPVHQPETSLRRAVWNPGRRLSKTILDLVQQIVADLQRNPDVDLRGTIGYVGLLELVSSQMRALPATSTQFAVVSVEASAPAPLFTSALHRIQP